MPKRYNIARLLYLGHPVQQCLMAEPRKREHLVKLIAQGLMCVTTHALGPLGFTRGQFDPPSFDRPVLVPFFIIHFLKYKCGCIVSHRNGKTLFGLHYPLPRRIRVAVFISPYIHHTPQSYHPKHYMLYSYITVRSAHLARSQLRKAPQCVETCTIGDDGTAAFHRTLAER